jgi:MFS family permease
MTVPALWVVVAGVAAALHLAKLIPALPVLQQELGLGLVQAGFLLSTVQAAGMVLGLAAGAAAQSWGLARSMSAGLMLLSLASVAGAAMPQADVLLATRVAEGLGFLLVVTSAPGLVRMHVPPERLGAAMGIWGAYMPLATSMALLLSPPVIAAWGWRVLWLLLGLLSAGLAALVWVRLHRVHQGGLNTAEPAPLGDPLLRRITDQLRVTLSHPGPWLLALCFVVYSGQWLAVVGFLPTLFSQAQVPLAATAWLTALAAGVNIIGNVGGGRLLQAGQPPLRLVRLGYLAMALFTFMAYADWPVWLGLADAAAHRGVAVLRYLCVLGFSAAAGVVPATLFALAVRLAPADRYVAATAGWMQQGSASGQFFGPPLVAWVAALAGGWQWTWVFNALCSTLGLALTIGLAFLLHKIPLKPAPGAT